MKREEIKKLLKDFSIELDNEQETGLIDTLLNMHHDELNNEKELMQAETAKLEAKEDELKEANKTIKNLEKNRMDPEEVQNEIAQYKETIAGLQQDLRDQEVNSYISTQLTLAGAHDVEVCQSNLKFDREKIKSKDDYSIIDDAIKTQIKEKSFLYKDKKNIEDDSSKSKASKYNPRVGNGHIDVHDTSGKDFAKIMSNENIGFSVQGVNQK